MKHIIYVGIVCLLYSCSKTEQFQSTKVSGQVIDGITERTFTRGTVELIEVETPIEPFSPIISRVIDQQPVGEDGTFRFEFNAKHGDRYSYQATIVYPEGEMFGSGTHNGNITRETIHISKKGNNQDKKFIIYPYCEIKFLVYNQNEYDENDTLLHYVKSDVLGKSPAGGYVGGGGQRNLDENEKAQFSGIVSGHMTIEWHVIRNGQTEVFSEEIFVEHNERRVYEIYY
ncbi:MAG: hypothetical protein Salg2KO_14700 [Salibacteraceae bacterium]